MTRSLCRSCDAPIEWALTEKGRRIPLDPDPVASGNITLVDGIALVVKPGEGDRVSHFVTCPTAGEHRSKRR